MALKPSNVVEWLQAERLAGNEWANDLLDLWEDQDAAQEHANAFDDLRKQMPKGTKPDLDPWRVVEWLTDRIGELGEIAEIVEEFGADVAWPNGSKPKDAADKLRAMFESGHWLQHDL